MTSYAKGTFSLYFTFTPNDDAAIVIATSIGGVPTYANTDAGGYQALSIKLETDTSIFANHLIVSFLLGNVVQDSQKIQISSQPTANYSIWICIHDNAVSVNCNGRWIAYYVMGYSSYEEYTVLASINTVGGAISFSNIRREELPDWRDAVFVDYESTGANAIGSIIQQRPIWTYPQVDRKLAFTYNAVKDGVPSHHVKAVQNQEVANSEAASDGLVYYRDVGVSLSKATAEDIGLVTKLYRLSELDYGGVEAAAVLQKIALEHRYPVQVDMTRIDPRMEISDLLQLDLVVSGTQTELSDDVIMEDIQISLEDGQYSQSMTGRRRISVERGEEIHSESASASTSESRSPSVSASPSTSESASPSVSEEYSESASPSESISESASESASPSASISPSASPSSSGSPSAPPGTVFLDMLMVGAGGGGVKGRYANDFGGGGGGGQVVFAYDYATSKKYYAVTVGDQHPNASGDPSYVTSSVIYGTALGGLPGGSSGHGGASGSGFGGGATSDVTKNGGGGGGAGAVGGAGHANIGGNGGAGMASNITGVSAGYGGGGGGSGMGYRGNGVDGGGNGGQSGGNGYNAMANRGGGGGGCKYGANRTAGHGGKGVVVIRYKTADCTVLGIGGAVTTVGEYTIHTFNTSGTFFAPVPAS